MNTHAHSHSHSCTLRYIQSMIEIEVTGLSWNVVVNLRLWVTGFILFLDNPNAWSNPVYICVSVYVHG